MTHDTADRALLERTGHGLLAAMLGQDEPLEPVLEDIKSLRDALARRIAEGERLREAIEWALGECGDFPPRQEGEGAYWWRAELRKRAALVIEEPQR